MAKVFTITPGLENMGAMKTGGQGSVYKGRRIGEIITAVKLLPTPIHSENDDDKNFRDFKNEVQKLKKVNEKPNPNVVKILSSGLSETGSFPFIEMEYIEGPDLEELLKLPHGPVFTIKEVIKVAEHLSNALAHCHSLNVKHGDIKSNNVKLNIHTGNYVLLDFGLAIMSDEQRRTSLRQAGAVEFMAPEQNEGLMFFETDVYSFGVVLFELLAGKVPFPLEDKGEMARNSVRLAHMDTLPPDIVSLRKNALPLTWPEETRVREMNIPDWLIKVVYKCLKKKPENRFASSMQLHEYIIYNTVQFTDKLPAANADAVKVFQEKFLREKDELQQQIAQYKDQLSKKELEFNELKSAVFAKNNEAATLTNSTQKKGISTAAFAVLVFLTIGFATYSAYSLLKSSQPDVQQSTAKDPSPRRATAGDEQPVKRVERKESETIKKQTQKEKTSSANDSTNKIAQRQKTAEETDNSNIPLDEPQAKPQTPETPQKNLHQYMVTAKAYFYNAPDESTRRNAFVVPANNAVVNALDEQDDFVYVVFTNQLGQSSRGWLRKKDLQQLNE